MKITCLCSDFPKTEEAFRKHCGKRRKYWLLAFSHNVFCLSKKVHVIIISVTLNLTSANAFNLVWSKNLSFGKGLTHYQTTKF